MSRAETSKYLLSGLNTILISDLGWFYINTSNSAEAERFYQRGQLHHFDSLLTVMLVEQKNNFIIDNSQHQQFEIRIDSLEKDSYKFYTQYLPYLVFKANPNHNIYSQ